MYNEEKKQHYNLLVKFSSSYAYIVEPIRLLYQMETTSRDGHFDILIVQGRTPSDYWSVGNESITFHRDCRDEHSSIFCRVILSLLLELHHARNQNKIIDIT